MILSLSLRFCNAFKTYCKTLVKNQKCGPKTLYAAHGLDSKYVVLVLFLKTARGSNPCARRAFLLGFYKAFLIRGRFGTPRPPETNLVYFCFTGFIIYRVFLDTQIVLSIAVCGGCYIFLNGLGWSFSMFWEASKLWRCSVTVYMPMCS